MASTTAIRAGRAFVELFADNSKLVRGLREAERHVKDFGNKMQALGLKFTMIGAMAAVPFGIATKVFADFDDQMRAVSAVTGATETEFESLTEKAKLLGRTTSYTAAQVAGAMLELGRAGFDPTEIDAAIAGMLDLARATGTDLAEATIYAGNTLRSFNLPATEMTRVCDVLVATANNSAQTLTDLGESMSYCAPIASEYGLSLEQTAKALGSLANYGIKGSQAGTTLRRILTNLADPAIQKKLKELKINVVDENTGELRDVSAILRELGHATEAMSKDKKLGLFKELFGLYAIAGGAKLTTASFDKLYKAIDNATGKIREFSKVDIQNVKIELQKTGFDDKEIDAVTVSILALAQATDSDLATATASTTTLLNAFGLSADQSGRVADILTAMANTSGQSLAEMGSVIKQIAPITTAFGLSLEETAKAFAFLTASGMKSTQMGKTLQVILGKLSEPNVQKKLAELKIDIIDPETGKLKAIPDILQEIGTATADMPKPKQRDLLKEIFGDSLSKGVGLTQKQLKELSRTIDSSQGLASQQAKNGGMGAAARTAKRMDSGIGGSFRMLLSAVEGVAIAVGDALAPAIQKVAEYFTRASEGLASYIAKNKELIVTIAKVVVSIFGIGVVLLTGSVAILAFAKMIGLIAGSMAILAHVVLVGFGLISGAISAIISPVGLVIIAIAMLSQTFSTTFSSLGTIVAGFGNFFTGVFAGLGGAVDWLRTQFGKFVSFAGETFRTVAKAIGRGDIEAALQVVWASLKLIWVKGSTSIIETWYWVVDTLQTAWATCVYSLSELLISSWYGVQEFWTETVYTMATIWTEFSSGVVSAWKSAEESIAKGIGWIMAKMQGLDPEEMNRILTEQYDQQAQQREAKKSQTLNDIQRNRDSKMAALGTKKQGVLDTLKDDQKRKGESRNKTYQDRIAGQEAELQSAQTEYNNAIDQAKTPPEEKSNEKGFGSIIDSITTQVQNVMKGFQANVATSEKVSVTGSFSAAALRNMGTSSTMDRVAKATEKSEKHLDKIANKDEKTDSGKKAKSPENETEKESLATTELKTQTRLLRDIAGGAMHFA